jgi:hypothetical protein
MGRLVDVDDLIDAGEVAELCGQANRKAVAAALGKRVGWWREFPAPVIDRPPSRFWLRSEVQAWEDRRRRNPLKPGPRKASGAEPA